MYDVQNMPAEQRENYEHMAQRMSRGMDEFDRKTSHLYAYMHKQSRNPRIPKRND